ncbi:uncharacterized protein EDB93DRAFT_240432 [Suillus bovinus]|uniref:uncharacterized protein n=1 Tax=Suillus bovinus TaxID=48563 RepID=UPI001B86EAEE|nr:uncharacterized protein EDB93DRAFT_240432 [Suillus bovinus]KAG2153058.1 hypothetical protein EDB93DRAFT_240432 [Suillus bovinus]
MSSSIQIPPQQVRVDLTDTYGALFIGSILAAMLFGLTTVQAFIYFRTHAGRWTKFYRLVVLFLWTLDAVQVAATVHCVYYYLVTNFSNIFALATAIWSFKLQTVFNILTVYVIHMLYSHRIWIVGRDRSRIFRIIPGIVILSSSGIAIALIYVVYGQVSSGMFLDRWTVFLALSVATFLDILVTSSLWYLFASSRTGFSSTDGFITRLICCTINSGCLTSICALASILTCAVMPYNFIFLSIQFVLAKLYVNSYIALLNTGCYTQSTSNMGAINSFELRREHKRDSFNANAANTMPHDMSQEKFPSFRNSLLAHPDVEVIPPTRPSMVAKSQRSILVTVQQESFVDL